MKRRVVITGMGVISPLGCNFEKTWKAALEGKSGIGPITLFDASTFPCRIAAEVRNFNINSFIGDKKLIKFLNRGAQFGVAAAQMAMEDADLYAGDYEPARTGISLSSSGGRPNLESLSLMRKAIEASPSVKFPIINPVSIINWGPNTGASMIAMLVNARGPNTVISTACSGSSQATGAALRMIQQGDAEIMITGGHELTISEEDLIGFSLLGALSTRNEEPQRSSRPFDRERDGFVLGEGAAVIILEELSHALARGAKIYAELVGHGCSMNAYSITGSPPDGEGAVQAMESALLDANLSKKDVNYINAHGTSTIINDRSETAAIKRVFGPHAYQIPVSSTKSMTGHLIAAAGGLELAFCTLSLRDSIIPPTINYENVDPKCDLDYVPNDARAVEVEVAMSNSFAFGGSNSSLVVKSYRGGNDV
jgi:3-oxoacyl-[acyl-carrier-protein] synthase II